ncbi:MAG: TraX family protein [Oscillospiraceae bacterium]
MMELSEHKVQTIPEKYKIFSGSTLKMIAVITMLIDHIGHILLSQYPPAVQVWFELGTEKISWYWISRTIGRTAFPIYCFLLTEGYLHTHDRKKYGLNLLVFAFISEIPWNLEHIGKIAYSEQQNVFFTLFLGYLGICIYESKLQFGKKTLCMVLLVIVTLLLHTDYGVRGIALILVMHMIHQETVMQGIISCGILTSTWKSLFAFIPITMYNGKRGFIQGKFAKYCFYAFYPVHMFILYLLRKKFFGY